MVRVLLASPLGGDIGGIASWTKHILTFYSEYGKGDVLLGHIDISRRHPINSQLPMLNFLNASIDNILVIFALRKKLRKEKYDVCHFTSSAGFGLIRDRLLQIMIPKRVKIVMHFRFGRVPELYESKGLKWRLLCQVINKSALSIVLDMTSYTILHRIFYNKVRLLPNPIAPQIIQQIQDNSKCERKKGTILFVGHCYAAKGVFELLDACQSISDIFLKIIGPINDEMCNQINSKYNHPQWLQIEGKKTLDYVIQEMMKCEVFVLPSHSEGFPNVILEAMACGCSIIATKVGAISEMLEPDENGDYGILIEKKNTKQLVAAINRFLADGQFAEKCRQNVKRRVSSRYAIKKIWQQMLDIWEDVAN